MVYEGVLLFAVVFLADYLFDTLTQSKHGLMLRSTRQAWLFLVIGGYFLFKYVANYMGFGLNWNFRRLIGM